MNYDSMQALVNAGGSNMVTIVNTYDDDGSINISSHIPSWLKIGNKGKPTSAYFYSNSYLIFSSMTIEYNNRDGCRQAIYKEEGVVNGLKFFKLRFFGASRWGSSYIYDNSYKMIYDIVFIENGDFMIYADTIPPTYFTGAFDIIYNMTTMYNKPTSSSRYVSFIYNSNSNTYIIDYKILDIKSPTAKKFILTNNEKNVLYYFNNNSLISVSAPLTANNVKTYGYDLSVLKNNISQLLNFDGKLCYWVEQNDYGENAYNKTLELNAIPKPQFLITKEVSIPENFAINNISINENATDLMFLFDDSDSWLFINDNGDWDSLYIDYEGVGMPTENLSKFKDKIETKFKSSKKVKIRYRLDSADDYINNVQMLIK